MRYITPRKAAVGMGASHTGTEHHWWMTVSSAALVSLTTLRCLTSACSRTLPLRSKTLRIATGVT